MRKLIFATLLFLGSMTTVNAQYWGWGNTCGGNYAYFNAGVSWNSWNSYPTWNYYQPYPAYSYVWPQTVLNYSWYNPYQCQSWGYSGSSWAYPDVYYTPNYATNWSDYAPASNGYYNNSYANSNWTLPNWGNSPAVITARPTVTTISSGYYYSPGSSFGHALVNGLGWGLGSSLSSRIITPHSHVQVSHTPGFHGRPRRFGRGRF